MKTLINPIIGDPFSEDAQDNAMDYAEILNVDGVMGTLEIPKIKSEPAQSITGHLNPRSREVRGI